MKLRSPIFYSFSFKFFCEDDMEEERDKLKEIIKRAKEAKINLENFKIPKNYENHFKIGTKWKILILAIIFSLIYGKNSHLIDSQKVRVTPRR